MTNLKSMTKAQLIALLENTPAPEMLDCDTCGKPTVRKSPTQKRCPECREAKETASTEAWVAKKADPEKVAKRTARKQWNDAKGSDTLRVTWGIPMGTSLNMALEGGLLVMDAEGNLSLPGKAPEAVKAQVVEVQAQVEDTAVALLVKAGFTQAQAEALIAAQAAKK